MLKIQIKYGFLWALLAFFAETSFAQVGDSGKTYQGLILDEVMVKAVQQGFDVKGFIAKMKQAAKKQSKLLIHIFMLSDIDLGVFKKDRFRTGCF